MSDITSSMPARVELHGENGRALAACGLWSGVGFVGASTLAAILAQGIRGDQAPTLALVIGFAGGLIAGYAWRRARLALASIDPPDRDTGPVRPAMARFASGF